MLLLLEEDSHKKNFAFYLEHQQRIITLTLEFKSSFATNNSLQHLNSLKSIKNLLEHTPKTNFISQGKFYMDLVDLTTLSPNTLYLDGFLCL